MRRENGKKEYYINIEERHWRDIKDKGEKNELRYKESQRKREEQQRNKGISQMFKL